MVNVNRHHNSSPLGWMMWAHAPPRRWPDICAISMLHARQSMT